MKYIILPILKLLIMCCLTPIFITIDIVRYLVLLLWNLKYPEHDYWACSDWNFDHWDGEYCSNDFSMWNKDWLFF